MRTAKNVSRLFALGLMVAVLLGSSATTAIAQRGLARAIKVKKKNNDRLFAFKGVVATGISANADNESVIHVYTKERIRGVPKTIDGFSVEQHVVGEIFALNRVRDDDDDDDEIKPQPGGGNGNGNGNGNNNGGTDPTDRFDRPVPIGVSMGSTGPNICFAGTLGCRLIAADGGNISYFILTNNHVGADENRGTVGSDMMLQPGTLDNGCVLDFGDTIGTLDDFIPLQFGSGTNFVDAAIASTTTAETGFASPTDAYGAPLSTTVTATVGMTVQKFGRTTGYTQGIVDAVNVSVNVSYEQGNAYFENQIIIKGRKKKGKRYVNATFSDSGDSGSLIVTDPGKNPTGLLFAGNSTVTIANPIDVVLDAFEASNGRLYSVDDGN